MNRENYSTPIASPNMEVTKSTTPTSKANHKYPDGYCPHPHAANSPINLPTLSNCPRTVTTMASGRTFGSNTITSVLAGRAQTATVSVNVPGIVPSLNIHPATSVPQNSQFVSKSPLEMVQNVVSSIQVPQDQIKQSILVSSNGQLIMTNNGQAGIMPPPPPKQQPISPVISNTQAPVTQVIPGMTQLGQQTVLLNALPTPFVIQPSVMTVDGMTVSQNMQLPQLVTVNQQQIQIDDQNRSTYRQPTLISPDGGKRKGKKRKIGSTQMLQVPTQNTNVVIPQSGFGQSFQMAHSPQGVNSGQVLQALTIVQGKGGQPQIVMNGQSNTSPFGQQIITTGSQPTQQINLLQPVNLLNGATGMVQNFSTIQQFIVPGLGGMVMATDGSGNATLLPETQSVGMQLQLQNVNGQNVLTPVQNTAGKLIRGNI